MSKKENIIDQSTGVMKVILNPHMYQIAIEVYGEKYVQNHYIKDQRVPIFLV